jgi:hypothetical protein
MSIPPNEVRVYEKVPIGKEIIGTIYEVQEKTDHEFTFEGEKYNAPAVRLVFDLEGCKYKKYTRWMRFSYSKKAGLYTKYMAALVENPVPNMFLDVQVLKGMLIKTVWQNDNGDYQSIATIEPIEGKIKYVPPAGSDNIITNDSLSSGTKNDSEFADIAEKVKAAAASQNDEEIPF